MSVTNAFAGADYVPGENQSTVEGTMTQGSSTASTAFGSSQVPTTFGGGSNTPYDLLNPSTSRRAIAGLLPGGVSGTPIATPQVGFQNSNDPVGASAATEDDWRVRVSLSPNCPVFYNDPTILASSILYPLKDTNGVIWPYTPTVSVTHSANYTSAALTHSNYPAHFYNNSEVQDITISGDFTVQSQGDGQYLMAVIYFFRSVTKMFFGQGADVGNPPPLVFLDGYGSHYLPHVPCVVTSFSHTMPNEVDYVQIPITSTTLTSTSSPAVATDINPIGQGGGLSNLNKYAPDWNLTTSSANSAAAAQLAKNNALANATKTSYSTITTTTRMPTASTISVTLRPMYSRNNLHNRFDLRKFASGGLLGTKDGNYGGFI